ncbi:homocysteine S-methyltransferase family protein [Bacteroides caecimuris]|uniref:Homocysteine S-methyltransferase family protein n=2 Tax=Bacteroides caecimuris TaxID=1796613 RepID=A0A4S2CZI5_9BACE|nr:homocysteine S-methyltransferase family protein [Bacteroides caecimuris]
MTLKDRLEAKNTLLMEGALGERLKREFGLDISGNVGMASLVYNAEGRNALRSLWLQYLSIANEYGLPFLATTPTRRANHKRVLHSGYSISIIKDNVKFLQSVLKEIDHPSYLGGLMGCRGNAYTGEGNLSEDDAFKFHRWQAGEFAEAGANFLFAGIMPTLPEATGMARAMTDTGLPYIISFTIKPDGCLIDGTTINDAINIVDSKVSAKPLCYMTNCIHPRFVVSALEQPFNQTDIVNMRFRGIQANTAELEYKDIDGSDLIKATSSPESLAADIAYLHQRFNLSILGGCCGTDNRHITEIAKSISSGHHPLHPFER